MTAPARLTREQIERLWDAFEAVDKAVGPIAFGTGYITVSDRAQLREAVEGYRATRDAVGEERSWDDDGGRPVNPDPIKPWKDGAP